MASELSSGIDCRGDLSEGITDPCRETQLRKMYDQLQLLEWPKIKEAVKSQGSTQSHAQWVMEVRHLLTFKNALHPLECGSCQR